MIPAHLRDIGHLMRVEKNDERISETVPPHFLAARLTPREAKI
ncbi:hypothetical protein DAD186_11570 [Dermabacter vaginalis]|uniref:Uncharacterized protein n=1 Tax=Dermabacter vaginalis TaxID=1630135 RepID=A0A1B0ZIG5_9MICO|nr:hypothetical protein DAD186_11570 [Dermabacter vaginalis]